ncbi:MAG: DUF479 domain-containing protein [Bacteroidetes bacterium]|nr:MAG: DUF479 domain-containing protein [Bacteroidota bacterium]TAF92853.1 MAG: DUF479 domain-containing protein [Bacteroidota bacterium]
MNYLGHAYLSFYHPSLCLGNLMNDFVRGKQQYQYSPAIQQGFALHRAIDIFTDEHASTKAAKALFTPVAGRYAGVMMDIVYDYFLANDTQVFTTENSLEKLAEFTYQTLQSNEPILPTTLQKMLPYMVKENWLVNYQHTWGIQKSMQNIVRRASQLPSAEPSLQCMLQNQAVLLPLYKTFIADVSAFVKQYLQKEWH